MPFGLTPREGDVTAMYQLIFRGEVIEGQHPAVVRKRLALALKLDDARIQALFTGTAVVVRKSVDAETAARFQAAFRKAGARLRVVAVAPAQAAEAGNSTTAEGPGSWGVLPPGADLLDPAERQPAAPRNIDVSHLALARQLAFQPQPERYDPSGIQAPEFEILAPGSLIGEPGGRDEPLDIEIDFELAEPGARLGPDVAAVQAAPVPVPAFGLAEPGVRMSEPSPPPPPAPDVSHLKLE